MSRPSTNRTAAAAAPTRRCPRLPGVLDDRGVDPRDRIAPFDAALRAAQLVEQPVDRDRRRPGAARTSAHAVGDDERLVRGDVPTRPRWRCVSRPGRSPRPTATAYSSRRRGAMSPNARTTSGGSVSSSNRRLVMVRSCPRWRTVVVRSVLGGGASSPDTATATPTPMAAAATTPASAHRQSRCRRRAVVSGSSAGAAGTSAGRSRGGGCQRPSGRRVAARRRPRSTAPWRRHVLGPDLVVRATTRAAAGGSGGPGPRSRRGQQPARASLAARRTWDRPGRAAGRRRRRSQARPGVLGRRRRTCSTRSASASVVRRRRRSALDWPGRSRSRAIGVRGRARAATKPGRQRGRSRSSLAHPALRGGGAAAAPEQRTRIEAHRQPLQR